MQPRPLAIPKTYADLLRCVQRVMFAGQREIDRAWVRTYHETGRLIHSHILLDKERADYGASVFRRLARDSGASERKLYECAQFYRLIPILRRGAKFNWAHYRVLCQIEDEAQRAALMSEAARRGWTSPELITRVRALNAAADRESVSNGGNGGGETKRTPPLLRPKRGIAGRYRVIESDGALCVDLGFKLYLPLSAAQTRHRAAGEIVRLASDGSISAVDDGKPSDLFTYRAAVRRVIDGDTLEIAVALPYVVMREKLRLRGIDCPEMDTAEGKAAKRVVDVLVAESSEVTIVTSKVDKYDRYLADVHLRLRSGEEVFINNHLLAHGHAGRMDAAAQDDWVP